MLKRRWKKLRFFGGCTADVGCTAASVVPSNAVLSGAAATSLGGVSMGVELLSLDAGRGVSEVLLAAIVCSSIEGSETIVATSSKFICSEGAVCSIAAGAGAAGASGICSASGVEVSYKGTCVESAVSSGVKFDASWEGVSVGAAITSIAMAEVSSTGMGAVVASDADGCAGISSTRTVAISSFVSKREISSSLMSFWRSISSVASFNVSAVSMLAEAGLGDCEGG